VLAAAGGGAADWYRWTQDPGRCRLVARMGALVYDWLEEVARQYVKLGADWMEKLQFLFAHIGHRFGRMEMQQQAWEYLGVLSHKR